MISYPHMRPTIFSLLIGVLLQLSLAPAYAQECTIIYGGGQVGCAKTAGATTTIVKTPTPAKTSSASQTKGGLPIHNEPDAKTTPATGPEMLGLISLIPAAGMGIWLRRKTK